MMERKPQSLWRKLCARTCFLMDDRRGVKTARRKGLRVTGTIGVLDLAADRGLVDFADAAARLLRTNFRVPESLLNTMLEKRREAKRFPR